MKASMINGVSYQGTSLQPNNIFTFVAQILNSPIWVPPTYLNNYMSLSFTTTQIIHYIQIQGSSSGFVTDYVLHFRNKDGAPLICWNSCQIIKGPKNGVDLSELRLTYPIIAT